LPLWRPAVFPGHYRVHTPVPRGQAAPRLTIQGDIRIIGNTLLTCQGGCAAQNGSGKQQRFHNGKTLTWIRTQRQSIPAAPIWPFPPIRGVLFAALYWGGNRSVQQLEPVFPPAFRPPASGGYVSISGSIIGRRARHWANRIYHAFADVTSLVKAGKSGEIYGRAAINVNYGLSGSLGEGGRLLSSSRVPRNLREVFQSTMA